MLFLCEETESRRIIIELFKIFGTIDINDGDAKSKIKDVDKEGQGLAKGFEKVGDGATKLGKAMTKGITVGAVGIATASVKIAKDFEAGMSEVAAISGATGGDLQMLEDKARDLGKTTSFSATEAAEGLKYMSLAGWDAQESAESLEGVLHLAEAGALDLGRASDLTTDSMAALGLGVDDLDGYLDKVAQTSRKSNTDIDELTEAMVVAGGTFERLNVPLEESNAFLGVLANRGFKGSEAGTALNAIMSRLTQSTGPAAEALEDMGVSAFDSEGNFRGMEVVMKEVEQATLEMTDAEREHALNQIAGLNHGKTFSAMLNGLGDEYDELKQDIMESDGALKEMRDTMKDNLQGSLESMTSALSEVGLVIGNALIPFIKDAAEWIEEWANRFGDLDEGTQQTIIKIGVFIAAIGPLLVAFGTIAGSITKVIAVGKMLVTAWGVLAGAGSALAGGLAATVGFIFSPAGLIMIGIAAVIAIGVALYRNWDTIKAKASELKSSLSTRFSEIKTAITEPIASARDTVSGIVDEITGFFSNMKLSLPKITVPSLPKLPSPKIRGSFSLRPPSVPKISWNAEGAIFTKPTVFDTSQGYQGVGEAGAEAVLPISKLSDIMASTMTTLGYGKQGGDSSTNYNIEVNNPVAERSSDSIRKALLKQSYGMGGG